MNGVMGSLYEICEWVWRLAYINLLWIFFSLVGLILFGVVPATFAMFAVLRKWVMGEKDIRVFRTFWDSYRVDFWKTNFLGGILMMFGILLYIDFIFIDNLQGWYATFFSGLLILLTMLYFIMLVYIFPVFSHYKIKPYQYIKYAIHFGITSPLSVIIIGISGFVIYYLIAFIPGIIPFFSVSLISYVIMYLAYHTFRKTENKYLATS